jgi:NADH-quinone oxidoreductase subunit G
MGYSLYKSNKMFTVNDFYLFYVNPYFFQDLKSKNIYVFLGMNLRLESPILNIKFRKNIFNNELIYCNIGSNFNDNLNTLSLGLNIKNLLVLLKGKSKFNINFMKLIKNSTIASNFMFLVGNNLFYQKDNISIYKYLSKCVQNFKKFNASKYYKNFLLGGFKFLNKKNLNNLKKFDLNVNIQFMNLFSILYEDILLKRVHDVDDVSKFDFLYILNGNYFLKDYFNQFIVFQGHHIDIKLLHVNVVFPNTNFLEKANKFLNIEGKYLKTNKVVSKPYLTRND